MPLLPTSPGVSPRQLRQSEIHVDSPGHDDQGEHGLPFHLDSSILLPYSSSSPNSTINYCSFFDSTPLISVDSMLDSPLDLSYDSPLSDLLTSPIYDTLLDSISDAGRLESFLATSDIDYSSLFDPPPLPSLLIDCPPSRSAEILTSLPSPASTRFSSTSSRSNSLSVLRRAKAKFTGTRRNDTPVVSLDAPIQSRTYILPSSTSKKRLPVPVERQLVKRQKKAENATARTTAISAELDQGEHDESLTSASMTKSTATVEEESLPADLASAIEKKRLQNTISARKSRQRKQSQLQELTAVNDGLVEENELLKKRIRELEVMLAKK